MENEKESKKIADEYGKKAKKAMDKVTDEQPPEVKKRVDKVQDAFKNAGDAAKDAVN